MARLSSGHVAPSRARSLRGDGGRAATVSDEGGGGGGGGGGSKGPGRRLSSLLPPSRLPLGRGCSSSSGSKRRKRTRHRAWGRQGLSAAQLTRYDAEEVAVAVGAASSSRAATMSVSSGGVTAPCVPPPSAPSTNPNSRNSCVAYCGRRGAQSGPGILRRGWAKAKLPAGDADTGTLPTLPSLPPLYPTPSPPLTGDR